MRLDSAFPDILDRHYAVIKPSYPLITVLFLLKIQELAAVPLTSGKEDERRAVFGFSCLERFVKLGPARFASLLRGSCERAANELDSLTMDQELGELLDSFKKRGLGFAVLRSPSTYRRRTLVTLLDVLQLYERGLIKSDMLVGDVASPVFSMSGDTPLREALQAMFNRKYRRIFISNDGYYISDRTVIDYILNPAGLVELDEEPPVDHLDTPISRLPSFAPIPITPRLNLKEAAAKLRKSRGGCLIMNGSEIVTSWDVAMKPWIAKRAVMSRGVSLIKEINLKVVREAVKEAGEEVEVKKETLAEPEKGQGQPEKPRPP